MTLSATTRITTLSLRANARAFSTSFACSIGPWGDSLPSKKLNKYIIVAEDHTDSSALARRLEVRERHLEGAAKGKQVGRVVLGGAILRRDFPEIDEEAGPASAMAGSVMIVQGESIQDVETRLSRDEYVLGRVFDPSRTRIFPFLQAGLEAPQSSAPKTKERKPTQDTAASLKKLRTEAKKKVPKTLGDLRKTHTLAGSR